MFLCQMLGDLRKSQRLLSRKMGGSHHRERARLKTARLYQRVLNQRRDWFFKLAHVLVDTYDVLCFEDLNMKGMQKLWGKKVGDLARSEFMGILEYVALLNGNKIVYVDRFFPSSKMCSDCGYLNQGLKLSDREWICPDCGVVHDRDENAASNICTEGASSVGLDNVRLALASNYCLTPESHGL